MKLNKNGSVDLNEFVREITLKEKGKKEVDIAQTKQIAKLTARGLMDIGKKHSTILMLQTLERLAE